MTLLRLSIVLIVLGLLAGCNTLRTSDDPSLQTSRDPLRGFNRSVYAFNTATDKAILRPVSKSYKAALPQPVRTGVSHFFRNLGEPLNVVNNLLQGKLDRALRSTYRFTVNSTVGVLGLFDVAGQYDVKRAQEDFGQTLAAWGAKPGPYIMLPFLGPSNLRDAFGFAVDSAAYYPSSVITDSDGAAIGLTVLNVINLRSELLGTDEVLDAQVDPYSFLKVAYENDRLNKLYDGNPPETEDEDFDDF